MPRQGFPRREHPLQHVTGDDASGTDHSSRTDPDAGQDDGAAANPDVTADLDRFAEFFRPPKRCVEGCRGVRICTAQVGAGGRKFGTDPVDEATRSGVRAAVRSQRA